MRRLLKKLSSTIPASSIIRLIIEISCLTHDHLCAGLMVQKVYVAIVEQGEQHIPDAGLIRDAIRRRSEEPDGMVESLTEYSVLGRGQEHTLLRLSPITGSPLGPQSTWILDKFA